MPAGKCKAGLICATHKVSSELYIGTTVHLLMNKTKNVHG